ncbi:hypothetical protein K458DRAFT_177569 [Lentithecium fluviatile CBS 122367]|uniref:Uncharacterized protein n=1 Tax=Lentithecium fluviatile CBS 122367 TaxID=1168545 RepID=A0A6G1IFX7_9PLEO|nr:hypothetical protein K458DRAFT_177569 [Lentithecium fluviatile CBS 122367]
MREQTFIELCRQRVCATVERERRTQSQPERRSHHAGLLVDPQAHRRWEEAFRADIKSYAQALNLSFAHALLVTLPRQIRDRIYFHLLASSSRKITVCDGKLPRHIRSACNCMESHRSFWELPALKHYFDPHYMGPVVAREMAEAHYSTGTFYFDYHDLYLMHKFLTVDRFGYSISPKEHIWNIEVVLDAGSTCLCNAAALEHFGLVSTDVSRSDAIRWCLSELLCLTARSVCIKIIIFLNFGKSRTRLQESFRELLHIIIPFVRRFNELGFRFACGLFDSLGREWSIDDSVSGGIEKAMQHLLNMGQPFHLLQHETGG